MFARLFVAAPSPIQLGIVIPLVASPTKVLFPVSQQDAWSTLVKGIKHYYRSKVKFYIRHK